MVYANNLKALPGALLQNEYNEGHEADNYNGLACTAGWNTRRTCQISTIYYHFHISMKHSNTDRNGLAE